MRIMMATIAVLFLVVATLSACSSESPSDVVDLVKSSKSSHKKH